MSGYCHRQGNGASHLDVISFLGLRIPLSLILKEHGERSFSRSHSEWIPIPELFFCSNLIT